MIFFTVSFQSHYVTSPSSCLFVSIIQCNTSVLQFIIPVSVKHVRGVLAVTKGDKGVAA